MNAILRGPYDGEYGKLIVDLLDEFGETLDWIEAEVGDVADLRFLRIILRKVPSVRRDRVRLVSPLPPTKPQAADAFEFGIREWCWTTPSALGEVDADLRLWARVPGSEDKAVCGAGVYAAQLRKREVEPLFLAAATWDPAVMSASYAPLGSLVNASAPRPCESVEVVLIDGSGIHACPFRACAGHRVVDTDAWGALFDVATSCPRPCAHPLRFDALSAPQSLRIGRSVHKALKGVAGIPQRRWARLVDMARILPEPRGNWSVAPDVGLRGVLVLLQVPELRSTVTSDDLRYVQIGRRAFTDVVHTSLPITAKTLRMWAGSKGWTTLVQMLYLYWPLSKNLDIAAAAEHWTSGKG